MATPQEQLRDIERKALKIQGGIDRLRGGSSAAPRSGPSVITAEELENGVPQLDVQGAFQQANEASNEALGLGDPLGGFGLDINRFLGLQNQLSAGVRGTFGDIRDVQASRAGLEEQAGLPDLRTGLSEIEGEILQAETAFRRQVEGVLDREATGAGTKDIEVRQLQRRHNINRADLETIRFVRANRLEDASAAIDRKIQLQLEPLRTQLEAEKFLFENNSELFSKVEQRQFDVVQRERERKLNRMEADRQILKTLQLETARNVRANGGGDDVLKNVFRATTEEDVILAAGAFGKSMQDKLIDAQIANLFSQIEERGVDEDEGVINNFDKQSQAIDGAQKITDFGVIIGQPNKLREIVGLSSKTVKPTSADQASQNIISKIDSFVSALAVDTLVDAKARGATFGALNEQEFGALKAAATALASREIRDGDGRLVGYRGSVGQLQRDLMTMQRQTERAFEKITGQAYQDIQVGVDENGFVVVPDLFESDEDFWNKQ